jgi:hypothetical protein
MERKVDDIDEVYSSCDAYSHRKPLQIGGNYWLLRVYIDDNLVWLDWHRYVL